jgi:hypothetical protein
VSFQIVMYESHLSLGLLELAWFEELETQELVECQVELSAIVRLLSEYL